MMDLSESPLNQNAVNFLGSEIANQVEFNTMTRKIEFDKGIPQSFEYISNDVKTIDYSFLNILKITFKKIFSRPLHILILCLLLFYFITYLTVGAEVNYLGLSVTLYVHALLILIEFFNDLYNYFQIYLNDKKTNSQSTKIYDMIHKCFVNATWGDVRVGHIIKINKNEIVPADIIILETMDSNHYCYMDYSAITGVFENFVMKKACSDTQTPAMKTIKFNEYVKNIKGMLKYEEPNNNINSFTGRLKLGSFPRASDVTEENFVMRGSTVKNVICIYGLVVYTGMESKIMQILKHDKINHSNIIKEGRNMIKTAWGLMGYMVLGSYIVILVIVTLSYIHAFNYNFIKQDHHNDQNNLNKYTIIMPYRELFFAFFQYSFTFHLIIPFNWFNIALLALLTFGLFIKWDVKILQNSKNVVDIINYDCLSDFGQVKYILTDKTGTLTNRKFVLKCCSINGRIFTFDPVDKTDENFIFRMKNKYDINDLELYQELKSNSLFSQSIKNLFEYLCVCHDVKIRINKENSTTKKNLKSNIKNTNEKEKVFSSHYAEEKSILRMMKDFGYCVMKTKLDQTVINVNGENKSYYIVGRNKYTEERKRMSIIVKKSRLDCNSILLCKGSDISIFRYMKFDNEKDMKMIIDQIKRFSLIGYRFFIFCKREMTEDETNAFMNKYRSAENYVMHRDVHFEMLANEYEINLEFMGVLFFEEKINPDLRFSIDKLNMAQIYVWVVSGDKKENVRAVCRNLDMYKSDSILVEFSEKDDLDDLDIKMNMFLFQLLGTGGNLMKMKTRQGLNINVETTATVKSNKSNEVTMMIHGNCFNLIYNDSRLYQCFVTLLSYTTSLFAYSFTPNHKFLLCKTVKNFITKNSKVLAIGDGLNDFMMLKEADLSIGILSKEILQVRNTCDIIVSTFPQIVDLILVHGTWNTRRLYSICFFSIYSNLVIIFPLFLHNNSNQEGSIFFNLDYTVLTLDIFIINIAITLIFCFDQNIERPLIGLNSNVYMNNFKTQQNAIFSFLKYALKGILDSFIIYSCFITLTNPINIIGETMSSDILGYIILHSTFAIIFVKLLALKLNSINIMTILITIFALGCIIIVTFLNKEITDVLFQSTSYLVIILTLIFSISVCYLYDKVFISFSILTNPRFLYSLELKFKKYIEDFVLFLNFDEILKEISNENTNNENNVNKISYQEVMEKIYLHNNGIDPVLDNLTDINIDQIVTMKIRKPFLKFFDEKLETDYMNHFSNNIRVCFICYLISMTVFWFVDMIIQSIYFKLYEEKIGKILKVLYIISGISLLFNPLKEKFFRHFSIYFNLGVVIEIISIYVEKSDNDTKICLQMIVFFSFPLFFGLRKFKIIIMGVILYYVAIFPSIFLNDLGISKMIKNETFLYSNLPLLYHRALYIFGILWLMIIYGYFEELGSRISFLKFNKKTNEYKKDSEIYSNLVPEFIKEKMKDGLRGIAAFDYEIVTILFCDISDFDNLVASMTPKDMIYLLDMIYKRFDQFCYFHGLQKIETVGKTYMAAGGLKETEKDVDPILLSRHHAVRSFEMATDMLDYIQHQTFLENGESVKIKIGLHTGKVIAAVVGNHKPQFSLIGDTINTTARMCAYSQDMAINCSENSYEFITHFYNECTVTTKEVKGKGMMSMYLFKPFLIQHIPQSGNLKKNISARRVSGMAVHKQTSGLKSLRMHSSKLSSNKSIRSGINENDNPSIFIFENSEDLPEEVKSQINLENPKKKFYPKLSKVMTKNFEGIDQDSIDTNDIYNDSFYFIRFKEPIAQDLYSKFSYTKIKNSLIRLRVFNYLYLFVTIIGVYNLDDNHIVQKDFHNFSFVLIKGALCILLLLLTNYSSDLLKNKPDLLQKLIMIIYLLFTLSLQIQMNIGEFEYTINIIMEQSFTLLCIIYLGIFTFKQIFLNLLIYIIIFVTNIIINHDKPHFIKYLIFEIVFCLIEFIFILTREYTATFEYLKNKNENEKLKNIEKLLFNLMPQHVVQNLKEDIPVADVLYNVTILFADIVKFTDYSSQREPLEVVNMLTELFREMDDACERFNVYKVHTIGDCYVVMSFTGKVPMNERNYKEEAKNIVSMGESMIETIKTVRRQVNFEELNMRIGIHTGTVIAGIIGTKVVRYDIFGSDVLIANKMESGGLPGKINVSEDTKILLESASGAKLHKTNLNYEFTTNKMISVSSLNREINSFFIDQVFSRNEESSDS